MSKALELFPKLTEFDPESNSEGVLDPLGLFSIADTLALKLAPGFRERHSHPRFLTACAVGTQLCLDLFGVEEIGKDGKTEPYSAFEWLAVEGFTRSFMHEDRSALSGIPGYTKAIDALNRRLRLSPQTYLKTPSVFGFFGVYRYLSRNLGLVKDGILGEFGHELINIWQNEQGLGGFLKGTSGDSRLLRKELEKELIKSFRKLECTPSTNWVGWDFFAKHLHHLKAGPKEKRHILDRLYADDGKHRGNVFDYLASSSAVELWNKTRSERKIHEGLLGKKADDSLDHLLKTIFAYETLSRLLTNAFEGSLTYMSNSGKKVGAKEVSQHIISEDVPKRCYDLFHQLELDLEQYGEAGRFTGRFNWMNDPTQSKSEWLQRLFEHHKSNQDRKPPNGKNPFFDEMESGLFLVRTKYSHRDGVREEDEYVHQYRTRSILSFITDLE